MSTREWAALIVGYAIAWTVSGLIAALARRRSAPTTRARKAEE